MIILYLTEALKSTKSSETFRVNFILCVLEYNSWYFYGQTVIVSFK